MKCDKCNYDKVEDDKVVAVVIIVFSIIFGILGGLVGYIAGKGWF